MSCEVEIKNDVAMKTQCIKQLVSPILSYST